MAVIEKYGVPARTEHVDTRQVSGKRWEIILAGGEGTRLTEFTSQRYGCHRPKQYCAFWGGRTMLQWTLDRTRALIPLEHTKVIIGNGHQSYFARAVTNHAAAEVIEQPENFGTLPGILLPLSHILAEDPEATVLLLPSDHFIHPPSVFLRRSERAVELAERYPEKLVLLAAVPDSPVSDYGWVKPDPALSELDEWNAKPVSAFVEKPGEVVARDLYERGWLWNTMIVAAKAKLMWRAAFQCAEEILHHFNTYRQTIAAVRSGRAPVSHSELALSHLYGNLQTADFSRDLLQQVPDRCTVLPLADVMWCDCGHPERLTKLLNQLGEPSGSNQVRIGTVSRL